MNTTRSNACMCGHQHPNAGCACGCDLHSGPPQLTWFLTAEEAARWEDGCPGYRDFLVVVQVPEPEIDSEATEYSQTARHPVIVCRRLAPDEQPRLDDLLGYWRRLRVVSASLRDVQWMTERFGWLWILAVGADVEELAIPREPSPPGAGGWLN